MEYFVFSIEKWRIRGVRKLGTSVKHNWGHGYGSLKRRKTIFEEV